MRKFFSILLVAVMSLTFVAPLVASATGSESSVPLCCRRNGAHHCTMAMAGGTVREPAAGLNGAGESSSDPDSGPARLRFASVHAKCPYSPASLASRHSETVALSGAPADFAAPGSHAAPGSLAEALLRSTRIHAHPKRGPPSFLR